MIWEIAFWVSFLAILHSYVLYPIILGILAGRRKDNTEFFDPGDRLPFVSVIMSVHNEEIVISEKLKSIFHTSYPEERIEVLVGSDGSTDKTDEKLHVWANESEALRFFPFSERQGKPSVINKLRNEAMGEILIFTDANVMFTHDTLFELVKHFRNPDIGLVGANISNERIDRSGISRQEWSFISREIRMKYLEGRIWGTMIGAFGGCYAMRNEYFRPVPAGFAVDDFYITMKVAETGKKCILAMKAVCVENVQNQLSEEFRRKIRISSGNFQNLRTFYRMLWPTGRGLAFSFFSHKVLRWLGPFFLLILILASYMLSRQSELYRILLLVQFILLGLPILDFLLRKIGIHIVILRFITYFYSMNLALLAGFFKFLTGRETNVWKPTKRTAH
jgi:cellulose synthase/poly-beta-1,6-N-acetylglucosamine synthase-like glycosyltransferase